jgi:integrase
MALLSMHTGLRAGEILSLTWADVDLEQGLLTLRDTKSGRTHYIYMIEAVKKMLQGYPRGKLDALVFPTRGVERAAYRLVMLFARWSTPWG